MPSPAVFCITDSFLLCENFLYTGIVHIGIPAQNAEDRQMLFLPAPAPAEYSDSRRQRMA